jgi:hypothetical protein
MSKLPIPVPHPCPCGGEPEPAMKTLRLGLSTRLYIECQRCGKKGRSAGSERRAVERWNRERKQ